MSAPKFRLFVPHRSRRQPALIYLFKGRSNQPPPAPGKSIICHPKSEWHLAKVLGLRLQAIFRQEFSKELVIWGRQRSSTPLDCLEQGLESRFYSFLRATMGSTAAARRAGDQAATTASRMNSNGTSEYVRGSRGLVSKRNCPMRRVTATAPPIPRTEPRNASVRLCLRT